MKLNELIYEMGERSAPLANHGIDLSRFNTFHPLGDENSTIEQCYVDMSSVIDNTVLFRIHKDGKPVSLLAAVVGPTFKGKRLIQVKRTWTDPDYRKRGLITGLIAGLYRKWNYAIMSDNKLTDDSVDVWHKLYVTLKPCLHNTSTNITLDPSEYQFDDYFNSADNVFLLEHPKQMLGSVELPENWHYAAILSDHVVFTCRTDLP